MKKLITNTLIAMVAHLANRAYCQSIGDESQVDWNAAPQWQKDSAMAGVEMHLANPDATPADSHASWLALKEADGWVYGPVKDVEKKEHPCCVPYDQLPAEQKAKDFIFRGVVHAMKAVSDAVGVAPAAINRAKAVVAESGGTVITYIGRRESWIDNQYDTGLSFVVGQSRSLPGETAEKFLRHKDLFERADSGVAVADDTNAQLDAAKAETKEHDKDEAGRFDLIANVMQMDKPALKEFASTNYRQELNGRLSVEKLRDQVVGFIDQFGIV